MSDRSHGSACPDTAPGTGVALLKSLSREIPYRGCSTARPVRGTARTAPAMVLRALAASHAPAVGRVCAISLDLADCSWAPIPAWFGAQRWLAGIPEVYERHYLDRVAPHMPANPVSLDSVLRVAAARAQFADHTTGRNCRPTNATLARLTGLSERTVQRASKALALLGLATEVARGRQRTLEERYASWRVGDRGRGWASVWALHDCRLPRPVSPHPRSGQVIKKTSSNQELTSPPRRRSGTETAAPRRNDAGHRLARQWLLADDTPPWARRYRTAHAWAANLQGAALHGWSARDVNQLIRDFAGARWLANDPRKPIALLGAMLKWHGDLGVRPAAAEEAREAQELAAVRARMRADQQLRSHNESARVRAVAALAGPGRAEALRVAAAAAARHATRRTEQAAREVMDTEAVVRAARGLGIQQDLPPRTPHW